MLASRPGIVVMMGRLVLWSCVAGCAIAFAPPRSVLPTQSGPPGGLRRSCLFANPVPPEDKANRPSGINPSALPDATTPNGIAALLEVSFVQACMQLSSGYVDTLKLFIASAFTAYERGFTASALNLELGALQTQTAGRPLMQEEVELRTVWLCLVFLTLENIRHPSAAGGAVGDSVPGEIRQKFQTFVYDVVNAAKAPSASASLMRCVRAPGSSPSGIHAAHPPWTGKEK